MGREFSKERKNEMAYQEKRKYPDFYDALVAGTEMTPNPEGGVTVKIKYNLLGCSNDHIIGTVASVYEFWDQEDQERLDRDLRRLNYCLPYEFGRLPEILKALELEAPLVEIMVQETYDPNEPNVFLVQRHAPPASVGKTLTRKTR